MANNTQTRLESFLPATSEALAENARVDGAPLPQIKLEEHKQRVYVLCGVVGSGKSTMAEQFEALYPSHYVRVNQDTLGTKRKCIDVTRAALLQGKSALIDRQNFDASQRYTWIEIGHEFNLEVVALVFQTPKESCARRLQLRRNHETVSSPEQALQLLSQFSALWSSPGTQEGFHRIVALPATLPLRYTVNDVNGILRLVEASPVLPAFLPSVPPAAQPAFSSGRGRGSWNRGRGRGATSSQGSRTVMSSWLNNASPPKKTVRSGQMTAPALSNHSLYEAGSSRAQPYSLPARNSTDWVQEKEASQPPDADHGT